MTRFILLCKALYSRTIRDFHFPINLIMIVSLLTYLLISNALTLRKEKSILFSRIVMLSLILASVLAYNNIYVMSLDKGIGLYGGLFHVTLLTHSFNIFVFIVSA